MSVTEFDVSVVSISQATTAIFNDLYIRHSFLFFIEQGSKHVSCPVNGQIVGNEDEVLVFPASSIVKMQNRPMLNADYRATGLCYSDELISTVFNKTSKDKSKIGVQRVENATDNPFKILTLVQEVLAEDALPSDIRRHRLIESLLWLKSFGVSLHVDSEPSPLAKVRDLIETDLSHSWRASEVASHFAMSEATMRRWLSSSGEGFSKILHNTRLERGLSLLQTTTVPILDIALTVGFKTQSHFSDAFKQRFGITPSQIRHIEE